MTAETETAGAETGTFGAPAIRGAQGGTMPTGAGRGLLLPVAALILALAAVAGAAWVIGRPDVTDAA